MENNLMIFEGNEVEVFEWNDMILFNPKDVAKCLELSEDARRKQITRMNNKQVIKLKNSDVTNCPIRKLNNAGENFLTESGVYKMIFASRSEGAERFQDWVTDEVLPTIRKTGGYIQDNRELEFIESYFPYLPEKTKQDMVVGIINKKNELQAENDKLKAIHEENKPKVALAESITNSDDLILVGDMAKILKQNGINIGQNRLFSWLRENNYLCSRKGDNWNMPTQYSMELGLFRVVERTVLDGENGIKIVKTPKVTGKGQQYFINKFKNS